MVREEPREIRACELAQLAEQLRRSEVPALLRVIRVFSEPALESAVLRELDDLTKRRVVGVRV